MFISVGVQSPTEINALRGCAVILRRICQLTLTRITHQVSRAFDLNSVKDRSIILDMDQLCGIRWERKTGKSSNPGVAELRKTANDIGNTNRTNRIIDFKSNACETWCVILVSES